MSSNLSTGASGTGAHADTQVGSHGGTHGGTHPGTHTGTHTGTHSDLRPTRRISTETKASFKTTELIAYIAAVVGVLVAAAIVDASDFGAQEAWFYVTLLTIGYMVSRGLAKSGSRDFYDDDAEGRRTR